MSPTRRLALCSVALALAAFLLPAGASAFYDNGFEEVAGGFLVSADYSRLEQGDDTTRFAAISADGRYVAIETFSRNFFADDDPDPPGEYRAGGLFRFDLQTRALEKIADGNVFDESDELVSPARRLQPLDQRRRALRRLLHGRAAAPGGRQRQRRRLRARHVDPAAGGRGLHGGTGVLLRARLGRCRRRTGPVRAASLSGPGRRTGCRGLARRGDQRRRPAGRLSHRSRLEPAGQPPPRDVPAGQVFVRDLAAETTTLISAERNATTGLMTEQPAGGAIGAAISGDGSAVAWTGRNAASQTRFLGGENPDSSFNYYLWRRVAPGPGTPVSAGPESPTRRITGLADPDDPVCRKPKKKTQG